jgi:hypothetical protein
MLRRAVTLEDMRSPLGNHLEKCVLPRIARFEAAA